MVGTRLVDLKMQKRKNLEIVLLLVTLGTLVMAAPDGVNVDKTVETAVEGLPFLQFTNGGLRVNFAGYHAQAGLGGLLGGANARGGLHASAGTPWGAHASAGLGGLLGGDTGSAGGGLHARAGLGNGGPEAAAGLGGVLNGGASTGEDAAPRAEGGLFAGATAGNMGTVRKNVQVIKHPVRKSIQKQVIVPEVSAGLYGRINGDSSADSSASSQASAITVTEEKFIPAVAKAGLAGGLYAGTTTGVEKVKIPAQKNVIVQKNLISSVPSSASASAQGALYANAGVGGESNVVVEKSPYPASWLYGKRIQTAPLKKTVVYEAAPSLESAASASTGITGGIFTRAGVEGSAEETANASGYKSSSTFFDDIFNIPISTLTAVNQLLNNKGG